LAIDWVKNNKDAMKEIAISIAKFAVKKGIPLAGEQLGGIFADFLVAGMLQPELIPVAQTLGSMAGKKLGDMLADYIMSLGLADQQGNPDADKWLAITGQAIDAGKMAYSGYQGLKAVNNYLSGASEAGKAVGAVASAGSGLKRGRPKKIGGDLRGRPPWTDMNDPRGVNFDFANKLYTYGRGYNSVPVPLTPPPEWVKSHPEWEKMYPQWVESGTGLKRRSTAQMKKLLKEKLDNYHLVKTLKRGRGRPTKGGNIIHYHSRWYDSVTGEEVPMP